MASISKYDFVRLSGLLVSERCNSVMHFRCILFAAWPHKVALVQLLAKKPPLIAGRLRHLFVDFVDQERSPRGLRPENACDTRSVCRWPRSAGAFGSAMPFMSISVPIARPIARSAPTSELQSPEPKRWVIGCAGFSTPRIPDIVTRTLPSAVGIISMWKMPALAGAESRSIRVLPVLMSTSNHFDVDNGTGFRNERL